MEVWGNVKASLACVFAQTTFFLSPWHYLEYSNHTDCLAHNFKLSLHVGQRGKVCRHWACLWSQLTKLTDGSGEQSILRHHGFASSVCRAILLHGRHVTLNFQ